MSDNIQIALIEMSKASAKKTGKYQKKILTLFDPKVFVGEGRESKKIECDFKTPNFWADAYDSKGNEYTFWDVHGDLGRALKQGLIGILDITVGVYKEGSYRCNYSKKIQIL